MTEQLRAIAPFKLPGVVPNTVPDGRPGFQWVDPSTLFDEEAYQRDLVRGPFEQWRA